MVFAGSREHERTLGLASLVAAAPDRPPLVVLHTGSPNGFMEHAFRAGADDLITLPSRRRSWRSRSRRRSPAGGGAAARDRDGAMITVLGPKGGTGKTLTACNLAVALADRGARPVVVDLDLQFGDVGLALGLRPERTIYDLVDRGRLARRGQDRRVPRRAPRRARGPCSRRRGRPGGASTTRSSGTCSSCCGRSYDFVIVDTPPAFTPEVIAAIDARRTSAWSACSTRSR